MVDVDTLISSLLSVAAMSTYMMPHEVTDHWHLLSEPSHCKRIVMLVWVA